ncbi:hypothetical protein PMAYCL1PPCAC_03650 [Pristionchus mayeri]|uniref:RING-type domain-containing protein n=1 Tax=Pristionchus mayeri TaxID=1317129 RepID=A0AAN5C7D1_9BILA|nr:hypothetical protein PMAYCL1PPCAC_03650 [Pristionchus mayeri]
MAQMLYREESTNTIEYFRSVKIKKITRNGEETITVTSCKKWGYPEEGLFSNGVVWRGEAFFFNYGLIWALNLTDFLWRNINQIHRDGAPMWEYSDWRDLLLLTDESKGDFLFARFRPSSDDHCEYVITYSVRVYSYSDDIADTVLEANTRSQDGIITVPSWIALGTAEDERRLEEGLEDKDRKVPLFIAQRLRDVGDGIIPYPRSKEEAERIWKKTTAEEEKEKIEKMRKSQSSSSFSRSCSICFSPNPSDRAVFTSCGHLSCLACAMQLTLETNKFVCPFCRKKTSFIRIFEEEEGEEVEKETKEENEKNEIAKIDDPDIE